MRFIWQSNAPWAGTGYGVQTRLMLRALKDLGHEPVCFAFYGLNGGEVQYDGYRCIPGSGFDNWGNDVIRSHAERCEAEAVITLMDIWVLNRDTYSELAQPWIAWVPIDSESLGFEHLETLKRVKYPVAISQFGAEQMRLSGVEPAATIYHAVDTETFKPLDRWECRRFFELEDDAFVIGMVMANKGDRKQYPLQLLAIKRWMDEHPDRKVKVFLHTEQTSDMGGWDMKALVAKMGLKGYVSAMNRYDVSVIPADPSLMTMLYNSFDVLMNASSGEGFGVPIVEAQACGTPVITHAVTSMPEITINGYTVQSAAMGLGGHYGWMFAPDINDLVYRLECVWRMGRSKTQAGRDWVVRNCSVPVIANQWDQLLNRVAKETRTKVEESRVTVP